MPSPARKYHGIDTSCRRALAILDRRDAVLPGIAEVFPSALLPSLPEESQLLHRRLGSRERDVQAVGFAERRHANAGAAPVAYPATGQLHASGLGRNRYRVWRAVEVAVIVDVGLGRGQTAAERGNEDNSKECGMSVSFICDESATALFELRYTRRVNDNRHLPAVQVIAACIRPWRVSVLVVGGKYGTSFILVEVYYFPVRDCEGKPWTARG